MLSIITPVLNGSRYIESTIISIKELKISYEHIIVDGGSTDGTLEIVANYPSLKLINQKERLGMYQAIDMGIKEAKGEFITWVNSDDMIISKGFEQMYYEIERSNFDLVFSDAYHHFIDEHRYKLIKALPFARFFLKEGIFPFVQPSSIFKKSAYLKVGGFNYEKFKIIGDRDLFQRIAYDKELRMKYVKSISSVFLRYSESLLYRNLERVKEEHNYTLKTNPKIQYRSFIYFFRLFTSFKIR